MKDKRSTFYDAFEWSMLAYFARFCVTWRTYHSLRLKSSLRCR